MAVLAILMGILLPVIHRAREEANSVKCLSNLRQLALAVDMYARDNDSFYPTPGVNTLYTDWIYWQPGTKLQSSRIAPYVRTDLSKVLLCPSDDISLHKLIGASVYPYSYSINEFMARTTVLGHVQLRLTRVESPSMKILIIDESGTTIDDACWAPQNYSLDGHNLLSNRHDRLMETASDPNAGRGNVAYADGHAAFTPRIDTTNPKAYTAYTNEPAR